VGSKYHDLLKLHHIDLLGEIATLSFSVQENTILSLLALRVAVFSTQEITTLSFLASPL
jgi:hypothetical protein